MEIASMCKGINMELQGISMQSIFDDNKEELHLVWLTGESTNDSVFDKQELREATSAADLVGHLNPIHPARIQILGHQEIAYYQNFDESERYQRWQEVLGLKPPFLVVTENLSPPIELEKSCIENNIPLLLSSMPAASVIDHLRDYLSREGAPQTTMHGVFMDIFGMGVLITGESGLGKSELGLELVTRGHGLVADDAIHFSRLGIDFIEGRCPKLLENLLEVRGVGLLDIRSIFGETSVRRKMKLKLIVKLIKRNDAVFERLPFNEQYQTILGQNIRCVTVQIAAGRNMAVIVEAAVRNTILQMRGIDTLKEFMKKQEELIEKSTQHSLSWKDE
jgi:HPr kinase/phosphorylase